MHQPAFLYEAVVLFGTALLAAVLLRYVRIPAIIGFLLTGMAIGPSGFQLIAPERVEEFAELGLVLLLFVVGLELAPTRLLSSGFRLFLAFGLQLLLCVGFTFGIASWAGVEGWGPRVILGIAVALSSTAIVLKILYGRGELDSPVGITATGILLLQDVLVIGVMLFLPSFQTGVETDVGALLLRELAALVILVGTVLVLRKTLPHALRVISRYGGHELLTLFAVLMACGGAWLAGLAGWSLGLGSCIAGLLLADADQRHQLVAEITPFRDVFNALFFISLGMLVELDPSVSGALLLGGAVAGTILLKTAITAGAARAAGWPIRFSVALGVSMCTVSEFSYVLMRQAHGAGLFGDPLLRSMTAYVAGSMLVGALLFPMANPFGAWVAARLARFDTGREDPGTLGGTEETLSHHVIIVGYGVTGKNLSQLLKATHIPYTVVEMNPALAVEARAAGARVLMGDATRLSILQHAGLAAARSLVIAINDAAAAERIVAQVYALHPEIYTVVRVRTVESLEHLRRSGARLVIPGDFETSIEIAAHVLREFRVPANIIDAQIASIRAGGYALLRGRPVDRAMHLELIRILEQTVTETFYLPEESPACGKSLATINLRARTGATIIAVVRQGNPTTSLSAEFTLLEGDVLVMVGAHAQLDAARLVLERHPAADMPRGS